MSTSDGNYTPEEISEIILDFYQFLTTLHYDATYLKLPPPEGWSCLEPVLKYLNRSERVGEVMRRLPFFDNACESYINYKSRFVDYTTLPADSFDSILDWRDTGENNIWSLRRNKCIDLHDFFPLATGHESFGIFIWLNVRDGEIVEEALRVQDYAPMDIREYFADLKQAYRDLKLIPGRGRMTMNAEGIPERPENDPITEEEVCAQVENWGTVLDAQYFRQLYRQYGWPNSFKREDAFDAVDRLMEKTKDTREEWESDDYRWEGHWC